MGLRDLIANGVALADKLTADIQPTVIHRRWAGVNGFNEPNYDDAAPYPAIVEIKERMVRTATGEEKLSSHVVTILREPAAQGHPERNEPIDTRDMFLLSDGTKGVILTVTGFQDPKTTKSYFYQVYLAGS